MSSTGYKESLKRIKWLRATVRWWKKSEPYLFFRRRKLVPEFEREVAEFKRGSSGSGTRFILIATPVHDNLGDHAIAYTERKYLTERFPGCRIGEFSSPVFLRFFRKIARLIVASDVIVIDGGGSMGDLWIGEEEKMELIADLFPDNPVVLFPQTIFWHGSEAERERSRRVFDRHRHLLMTFREKRSFAIAEQDYPATKKLLLPDIVLYNRLRFGLSRTGVGVCFRGDIESAIPREFASVVEKTIAADGKTVKKISTVVPYQIPLADRDRELRTIWEQISALSLLITDRLHGAIFAYITDTPCICFDNVSGKVGEVCAKWLNRSEKCIFVHDIGEFKRAYERLTSAPPAAENPPFSREFSDFADAIGELIS